VERRPEEDDSASNRKMEKMSLRSGSEWQSTANVLVVDDQADRRSRLISMLSSEDCQIVEATSLRETLMQLVRREFALVLLGVGMKEIDGAEVATLMRRRARTRTTPIVFLVPAAAVAAAYTQHADGVVDSLTEPFDPDAVRAKVRTLLELFRKTEEVSRQADLLREAARTKLEFDIVQLKLAAERRYKRVAEAMPQIVWTANADGVVDYWNERWFEYTGLTAEQSEGTWGGAMHPDDHAGCRDGWQNAVHVARVYEMEVRLRRGADDTFRWHLMRAVPEPGVGERDMAWIGTFTDIHETKRILEERTRLYQEAQDAVRARDEFLSVASHELKSPITSLVLQNQILLRKAKADCLEAPQLGLLEAMGRQLERLGRLVGELLDVSRITAGRLQLELVARSKEEPATCNSSITLRAEHPVLGRWDRLRADQIVTNLLSNAIKYGAGKPIQVLVESSAGVASLVVQDQGLGIAEEDRARIFERFERASGTKAPGLGLGLYIVRQIVNAHGGSIGVVSSPGEGSIFTVELPLGR
jgi:PAS domain S-box-containing protein